MLFVIYIRDINFSMNCTYITQNMVPERCYFNALILKKGTLGCSRPHGGKFYLLNCVYSVLIQKPCLPIFCRGEDSGSNKLDSHL